MALETEKKVTPKTQAPAQAVPKIDASKRAAMLADDAPESWAQTGQRFLYKPEAFVVSTLPNGTECCWRKDEAGKTHFSAPNIWGRPYDTVDRDGVQGEYTQVMIELTRPTFILVGEGEQKIEQEIGVGETILLNVTKGLERLVTLAHLEDKAVEVCCRPIQKEPIVKKGGGKQTMWRWSIKESPTPIERVRLGGGDNTKFIPETAGN